MEVIRALFYFLKECKLGMAKSGKVTSNKVSYDSGAFCIVVHYTLKKNGIDVTKIQLVVSNNFSKTHTATIKWKRRPSAKLKNAGLGSLGDPKISTDYTKKEVEEHKTISNVKAKKTYKLSHTFTNYDAAITIYARVGSSSWAHVTINGTSKPLTPSVKINHTHFERFNIVVNAGATRLKPIANIKLQRRDNSLNASYSDVGAMSRTYNPTEKDGINGISFWDDDVSPGNNYQYRVAVTNSSGTTYKETNWHYSAPPEVTLNDHERVRMTNEKENRMVVTRVPDDLVAGRIRDYELQYTNASTSDPDADSSWKTINEKYIRESSTTSTKRTSKWETFKNRNIQDVVLYHIAAEPDKTYRYRIRMINYSEAETNNRAKEAKGAVKQYGISFAPSIDGTSITYNQPLAPVLVRGVMNAQGNVDVLATRQNEKTTADLMFIQRKTDLDADWVWVPSDGGEEGIPITIKPQYKHTEDVTIDSSKKYYTRTNDAGTIKYTLVTNPTVENLSLYYEVDPEYKISKYTDTELISTATTVSYRVAFGCSRTPEDGVPLEQGEGISNWKEASEVSLLVKPNPPTLLTPVNNGSVIRDDSPIRLSWIHGSNDGTSQTAAQIRYRIKDNTRQDETINVRYPEDISKYFTKEGAIDAGDTITVDDRLILPISLSNRQHNSEVVVKALYTSLGHNVVSYRVIVPDVRGQHVPFSKQLDETNNVLNIDITNSDFIPSFVIYGGWTEEELADLVISLHIDYYTFRNNSWDEPVSVAEAAFYDLDVSGFNVTDIIEWSVRTKGKHVDYSDWSKNFEFKIKAKPELSITSPSNNSVVSNLPISIGWRYEDESGELDSMLLEIVQREKVLSKIDIPTSATEQGIGLYALSDYLFDDEENYELRLHANSTSGLSTVQNVAISIKYVSANIYYKYSLSSSFDDETGYAELVIDYPSDTSEAIAPTIDGMTQEEQQEFIDVIDEFDPEPQTEVSMSKVKKIFIYRIFNGHKVLIADKDMIFTTDEGGQDTVIEHDQDNFETVTDMYAPINVPYVYRLVQITELGEIAFEDIEANNESLWWYVYYGDNDLVKCRWNPSGNLTLDTPEKQQVRYSGRTYPVTYNSKAMNEQYSLNFTVLKDEQITPVADTPLDIVEGGWDTILAFRNLIESGGNGVWKSFEGDVYWADFVFSYNSDYTDQLETWTCSLNVTRIDSDPL